MRDLKSHIRRVKANIQKVSESKAHRTVTFFRIANAEDEARLSAPMAENETRFVMRLCNE